MKGAASWGINIRNMGILDVSEYKAERAKPLKSNKVKLFSAGRRCTTCERLLSVYNPGPSCWEHTDRVIPQNPQGSKRGRRPKNQVPEAGQDGR